MKSWSATKQDKDSFCFDKALEADPDWLVPLEIALIYIYYNKPSLALHRARRAVEKASDFALCLVHAGPLPISTRL